MTPKNSQDQLINFAMKELGKVLQDIKEGKAPEPSASVQKLASELEMASERRNKMTDEEIKQWAERIATEVSTLDD